MKIFTLAALISLAIVMPAVAEDKVSPSLRALMLKCIDDMLPVNSDGKNLAKFGFRSPQTKRPRCAILGDRASLHR